MANKCGDCVFLEKDDGAPYCLTLPLYTERAPDDYRLFWPAGLAFLILWAIVRRENDKR